ncbi:hypothetical protein K438DRAFT_1980511 [Mycena galopus ATCC 62051]|nr:hypothetical protein K438DRAFT_1999865 [Mycena galopus ATCC 62051]KAF8174211.1 hypothetical protein K438DRAFT_1980511 [Mycena galopus ATCC 62051]
MSTTQTYTIISPLAKPASSSGSGSITLSPSLAPSLSTSPSMASPSIRTSTSTSATSTSTSTPSVRFDAECVPNPKRPQIVMKSYSLLLWRKNTRDEADAQHVVLKVVVPKRVSCHALTILPNLFCFWSSLDFSSGLSLSPDASSAERMQTFGEQVAPIIRARSYEAAMAVRTCIRARPAPAPEYIKARMVLHVFVTWVPSSCGS